MQPESGVSDDAMLRRYLLGQLSAAELEEVEARLFADEPFWECLGAVEDELIDTYVRGELRGVDRESFESHFLAAPRRRERVALARAWIVPASAAAPRPARKWTEALRWLWPVGAGWRIVPAAALVAACGAVVAVVEINGKLARQNELTAGLQRQIGALTASQPPRPQANAPANSPIATTLAFVLTPGAQRDAGKSAQRIVIPRGSESIELTLPLSGSAGGAYRVVIQTAEGAQVWGADQVRSLNGPAGSLLRLSTPARVLVPGDYRVLLWRLIPGQPPEESEEYFIFEAASR